MMSSVFSGNSSAIRLMNLYADRHVYCNRGVNGIEGSLSTAVGFSMCKNKSDKHVYCVLGDLSFFYDQNALWNRNLNGKLRIIVLNNGGGAIFGKFQGLKESQAREEMIMAKHHATAEGICSQNEVKYLAAHTMEEMEQGISQLIHAESELKHANAIDANAIFVIFISFSVLFCFVLSAPSVCRIFPYPR